MIRMNKYPQPDFWYEIVQRPLLDYSKGEEIVKAIIEKVKTEGDSALKEFAEKFDKVSLDSLAVTKEELENAAFLVSEELKKAIAQARENITKFHASQQLKTEKIETQPGVFCWRKNIAISNVGLYIPGGTAPLFSTLLMLGIPAQLAGCQEIAICSPPDKKGFYSPGDSLYSKPSGN